MLLINNIILILIGINVVGNIYLYINYPLSSCECVSHVYVCDKQMCEVKKILIKVI